MANYGIKVSKSGDDVFSYTDANDLQFTSQYSTLKLYKWGTTTLTTNSSGNGSVNIAHDLGYAPAHLVFRKGTASCSFISATTYTNSFFPLGAINKYSDDANHVAFDCYTDSTNLTINCVSGTASTTFTFRYYIFVDLAQTYTGDDSVGQLKNWGFKVSKPGYSVLTAKEYNMNYSTRYKSLQYYPQSQFEQDLTLPIMWANHEDTEVEEMTYVDFNHNLGYAPLFMAFVNIYSTSLGAWASHQIPIYMENGLSAGWSVSGFCDSTRIRIYFWRYSVYALGTLYGNYAKETVNIKTIIFTENLASSETV